MGKTNFFLGTRSISPRPILAMGLHIIGALQKTQEISI
jgi:hypothetical protein